MEKLNLLWTACSNYNGTNILEERISIILCDILRNQNSYPNQGNKFLKKFLNHRFLFTVFQKML